MNVSASLSAAAGGDRAAWNAIVERFTPLIWATVRAHRLGEADAADVVQTTWLRLVEHLGRIQDPERLGAWLATTARRESLRVIAVGGRVALTDTLDDLADAARGPADIAARRERDALLRKGVSALSDRCRLLLRLLASEPPPSYDEIASILDMPIGSIGPTRGRCLAQLRDRLHVLGISGAA